MIRWVKRRQLQASDIVALMVQAHRVDFFNTLVLQVIAFKCISLILNENLILAQYLLVFYQRVGRRRCCSTGFYKARN